MNILQETHWSSIINFILQRYFSELITTCILWNNNFDFNLLPSLNNNVFLHIETSTLRKSFSKDVYNFSAQDNVKGVDYDDLIKKYVAAIEQAHCEGFLAFQDDIPTFAEAFQKASSYSIWRTTSSYFLFAYAKDKQKMNYFQSKLFRDQANILIVEAESMNSSTFSFKTNKFVGSIFKHSEELKHLSSFNAFNKTFFPLVDFFPKHKLQNLQGREIIVSVYDFRPNMAVDFKRLPQYYDYSEYNPSHLVHVDGTDIRICHIFCEIYNCTVQFKTLTSEEWASNFANNTIYGTVKKIMDGQFHIVMGALLWWYEFYEALDVSMPIGRSGFTCLVPAPSRLVSWSLPLTPFQISLWLAVFACIVLESLALTMVRRFEQSLNGSNNSSWQSSFIFGSTTTLRLFLSQSATYVINSHTVRTMLFACYMMNIIITSIYGGGLSTILTMPTLEEAADSVERLYKHNIPWTANTAGFAESIKGLNNTIYKQLYGNFKILTSDEIIQESKTANMAFAINRLAYGHFGNMDFIPSESLRRLKLMIDDIYWNHTVIVTPRLWAFLAKYNEFILAWRSSGLDKYWEWQISADYLDINKKNQIKASQHKNVDPVKLGMENFIGLIIPWVVGIMISIFVFMGELLINHFKKHPEEGEGWA